MSKVKILYGAYGAGNIGDDLILKAALNYHRNISPDCKILVVAYGKPLLSESIEWIDKFDFIRNPEKYLNSNTSLHFCGGGLFWAASHCDDMLKVAKVQKKLGGEVHIERIGVHGFHFNPNAVKELMEICDSITVRDKNSADLLKRYGITSRAIPTEDYVLTLKPSLSKKRISTKPIIAINHAPTLFHYDKKHRFKVLSIYKKLAMLFIDKFKFVYFPFVRHKFKIDQNDIIVGEYFRWYSQKLIEPMPFPNTVEEALEVFSTFSGAIGWRYHLLVLAKLFQIPSALLASLDENKYFAFASENNCKIINFDLDESVIISEAKEWLENISYP